MRASLASGQRSGMDRRKNSDRRIGDSAAYFSSGGIERRNRKERRGGEERRVDWGDWTDDWSSPMKRSS